ncbi:HIT family protein [Gordonia polyisoprenivorans]|uniref:HIT family protein n=1 Tax=Gordonia polyisoprenivorans TaxID=84595 RepID=UPI001AD72312|nr:HIT family protein [Gordonia polyisoprenivorans]QTI70272.1 HIT family protein [Gordonia polyisoprenivorans]
MTNCIFCAIVAGTAPSVRVSETETTYAFMDIAPGNDGHLLVIPKRHSTDLLDIDAQDLTAVTLEAQRIARAVVGDLDADGVNLLNCCGADAWQTVFHFHLHVIPRYADRDRDRLRLPWQPGVPGDRQVMTDFADRLSVALD